MHWIQKHILRQLSTHTDQRYIELKPRDVDGNLFMYHLNQLRKNGYVDKKGRTYILSRRGMAFSSRMSLRQGSPLMQPKIVVMLICQNKKGQYLLFTWRRQPYYGLVSFPFSKLHFGRTLKTTLQEALLYKAGLSGTFTHIGEIYIQTQSQQEISDHMLAHIYKVTNIAGSLRAYDGLTGQPFWGLPQDIPGNQQVPGFIDILQCVQKNAPGFLREIRCAGQFAREQPKN